jgi:hypothetical protein
VRPPIRPQVLTVLACAACAQVDDTGLDAAWSPDTELDDGATDAVLDIDVPDAVPDAVPDIVPDTVLDAPVDTTPLDTGSLDTTTEDVTPADVAPDDGATEPECVPACGGRDCGPDPFCGISCGTCTPPLVCNSHGLCVECVPDCSDRECGPDPVCSTSCGTCTAPSTCDDSGVCVEPGCPPPVASCSSGSESMNGCDNARTIGRPAASSGYSSSPDTCYASWNLDEGGCGDYGADHAYRIYMLEDESMHAEVDSFMDCEWEYSWWSITLKVYGNTGCDDTSCVSMLVCEDGSSSQSLDFTAPHDGWFFLVVDGWSAFDEGDYTLDVNLSCESPGCDC